MAAKRFKAVLERGDASLGWVIARVPFAPHSAWKQMVRLRVVGTVNGFAFRTSLFPEAAAGGAVNGAPGRYVLLVNKAMQKGGGVALGEMADFTLEPDMAERPAELPDELAVLLDEEEELRAFYDGLSEYTRREIGKWILGVKSDASRMKRAEETAERLLSVMEAEKELPPSITAAFRTRPKAKAGWAKLTPTQRRGELMAVFHYKTPESRAKRLAKMCDLAESKA
jgi:uncharacterized protein YdeI (YjbR/CyaY-like superfamily)